MLMNQILDSSNSLRDPHERSRSLKRSASVASLPTPPRTHHKHSRSRARSSASHHNSDDSSSASELDDDLGSGYAERIKRVKTTRDSKCVSDNDDLSEEESPDRKKRRTLGVLPGHDEDEEDENTFWTGRVGPSLGEKQEKRIRADKTQESSPSPAMLRYHVKAPVSPPPSRRQPLVQPARAASVEREDPSTDSVAPVTPPRRLFLRAPSLSVADAFITPTKPKASKIWPKRDSPNNPFLIDSSEKVTSRSEWDSSDEEEEVGEARVQEGTPTPTFEEKPTITYVFRGQKATFQNPLYGLAPEVIAASKLPIDHPDYEAVEACPPKRLFSVGKRKSRDRSRENTSGEGIKRAKVQCDEVSEGEESGTSTVSHKKLSHANSAETETKPVCELSSHLVDNELQSASEERERRETAAKIRLASRDGLRAGAVFADRDEPARRAVGPLRSS
ncbi:hypothetical protein HD554DRAFT_2177348 [Boletus coccyginus]|nr:hypothetical protein HD554DRAFT_2177348 [Boletus coccyginus]